MNKPRRLLSEKALEFLNEGKTENLQSDQLEPNEPVLEEDIKPVRTKKQTIERLKAPKKEPVRTFNLQLPDSLYQKLDELAHKTGRAKAEIIRFLLEEFFEG